MGEYASDREVPKANQIYNLRDIRIIRTEVLAGPEYVWKAIRGDFKPATLTDEPVVKKTQTRSPRKNDRIIVIQSPLRFKFAMGRLQSSARGDGSFDVKIMGSRREGGHITTSFFATQFLVITSWFPKVGDHIVAPKTRGGIIGKVTKIHSDGRTISILPKYDISRSRPITLGLPDFAMPFKVGYNTPRHVIDESVEISNFNVREILRKPLNILQDMSDQGKEDNNLVSSMIKIAKEIDNDKAKRVTEITQLRDAISGLREEINIKTQKIQSLWNDKLEHTQEIERLKQEVRIGENEMTMMARRIAIYEADIRQLSLEVNEFAEAKTREQDLDTFHCAICFGWICPISKHLFSSDELDEEFSEEELNQTVEDGVLECDNCHKRFHTTCLNNWLNTANAHGRCPFCREDINAVVPVKQLKMTWFANRLHLKF